jgi:hypothetical protein
MLDRPLRVFVPVPKLMRAGPRGLVSDGSLDRIAVIARCPQANGDHAVESRDVGVSVWGRIAHVVEMSTVSLADIANWLPPRRRRSTHGHIERNAAGGALVRNGLLQLGVRDPKAVLDGEIDTQTLVSVGAGNVERSPLLS